MIEIKGYKFIGGGACPEQYDVYKDEKQCAYVRLRWGALECSTEPWGTEIYSHSFNDFKGSFNSEKERMKYLTIIADKVEEFYTKYNSAEESPNFIEPEARMEFANLILNMMAQRDDGIKVRRLGKSEPTQQKPKLNKYKYKDWRKTKRS